MHEADYYHYSDYLKSIFGEKTHKITLATDVTCPTRDRTLGVGGCTFCDLSGSASFHAEKDKTKSIHEQIDKHLNPVKERFNSKKHIAYLQSYTNTYGSIAALRETYEAALTHPEIYGMSIGTRPDCISVEVLKLLEDLAQNYYVNLELGVQNFHDPTLEWYKRGHSSKDSRIAVEMLALHAPHVHVSVHLMFGAPTEPVGVSKSTAAIVNSYENIKGVKLHQLMVLKRTILAKIYAEHPFPVLDLEQYAKLISDFINNLRSNIYIERLVAKPSSPDICIAPAWCNQYRDALNTINKYLIRNETHQGCLL